jgi:hypothetical protein
VSNVTDFEELQGRLRGLLINVADQLPTVTVQLIGEMIDANEFGVALETLSEMLVESGGWISPEMLSDVSLLVRQMDLDRINVDRLKPRVRASAPPKPD